MSKMAWVGLGVGVVVVGGFLWARAGMSAEKPAEEPKEEGGFGGLMNIDFTDYMARALGDARVQSNVKDFAKTAGGAAAAFGSGVASAFGSAY